MNDQTARASSIKVAWRTAAMTLIGSYFLLSPVLPQVFDTGRPWVRQWTMFGGVGVGLLKGDFFFKPTEGEIRRLSVLDVHGLKRYPVTAQFYRYDGLIFEDADFLRLAAKYCAANSEAQGEILFKGRLGHGKAWRTVEYRSACGDESQ